MFCPAVCGTPHRDKKSENAAREWLGWVEGQSWQLCALLRVLQLTPHNRVELGVRQTGTGG